uniref:Uncharacterized protein n=1 Tax=Setaria viridis TaxID=4556 RepID=A0A4U6V908_SETVI|nr:hypothetical protein SEVIR_3G087666v2 [Setaria viridis]
MDELQPSLQLWATAYPCINSNPLTSICQLQLSMHISSLALFKHTHFFYRLLWGMHCLGTRGTRRHTKTDSGGLTAVSFTLSQRHVAVYQRHALEIGKVTSA